MTLQVNSNYNNLGESIQMDAMTHTQDSTEDLSHQSSSFRQPQNQLLHKSDYAVGIGLLLLVVFLWTASNFVTQDLYEGGYNKPFLVTYMNTSAFSLYLIPFSLRRWWSRYESSKSLVPQGIANGYQPLANFEGSSEEAFEQTSDNSPDHQTLVTESYLPPLTIKETAHLAFTFCLLWFIANWTVNASLDYTSVASATILSSMSGFFTLAVGRFFRVEQMTLIKIGAVVTSFIGVLLVSLSDSASKPPAGPVALPNSHQANIASGALVGDALALISALFYALYVILLKVRIKSEHRIDMQLFFGFVGLFNILSCWPIGLVLHLTGVEVFELPHTKKALYAILVNMAITLSSDYLYVLAMLKTTPLVVTVGLSLTIPVAVLGDFLRKRPSQGKVIAGALFVVLSFIAVGFEDSKEHVENTQVEIDDQERQIS
ncbi:hypothetical protein B0H34DRAFT_792654 [Crassisporium funariophilum]|nr:hypothetical protein B0H34DRAFT_792654 [Crassisporium funariophilum]